MCVSVKSSACSTDADLAMRKLPETRNETLFQGGDTPDAVHDNHPSPVTSTATIRFPSKQSDCCTYTFDTGPPPVPSSGRYRSDGTSDLRTSSQGGKRLAFGTTTRRFT